jgi:hypothetical protein
MTTHKHTTVTGIDAFQPSPASDVASFVAQARAASPLQGSAQARLMFALDATLSRQRTWDQACSLQAGMFDEAARSGRLQVQLVYYRGTAECRASRWTHDSRELGELMSRIDCRGGHTQIVRVMRHASKMACIGATKALVFVGDAFEESLDDVCAAAGELALRGVPAFLFQEGNDSSASRAFAEIARLTKGAHCRFDSTSAAQFGALLRGVAAYASGGRQALTDLAARDGAVRPLLAQLG